MALCEECSAPTTSCTSSLGSVLGSMRATSAHCAASSRRARCAPPPPRAIGSTRIVADRTLSTYAPPAAPRQSALSSVLSLAYNLSASA
eukprot:5762182-Pleurochrysis_carterae.AAC.1